MAKKISVLFLVLALAFSLAACSGKKDSGQEETVSAETETESEEELDEADLDEDEEIVVADYDPFEYVTLGAYTGLTADIVKTEVTDEDVELQIETDLEEFSEEKDKEDAAEEEDYAVISYTVKVDGTEEEDLAVDDTEIVLGWGDAGEEIENAVIGHKAGEKVQASMELDESFGEDNEGKTGEFDISIGRVYTFVTPELTDEFVKENLDYDTVDAYKEGVKKNLAADMTMSSRQEAGENLLSQVTAASECKGYPEDLYESVSRSTEEMYESYAAMFGAEREDLISDEDLEKAVKDEVNAAMVLKALARKENVELSEEEYKKYLEDNCSEYGFESAEELEEAYGEKELRDEAAREKVLAWLLDNNQLNELSQEEYDAKYGADTDEEMEEGEEFEELDEEEFEDESEEESEESDEMDEAEEADEEEEEEEEPEVVEDLTGEEADEADTAAEETGTAQ